MSETLLQSKAPLHTLPRQPPLTNHLSLSPMHRNAQMSTPNTDDRSKNQVPPRTHKPLTLTQHHRQRTDLQPAPRSNSVTPERSCPKRYTPINMSLHNSSNPEHHMHVNVCIISICH